MITLNIGCGRDPWGDIRLDLARSQTGVRNRPNLIASGLSLPIRSETIGDVRCMHVLEHVEDWTGLLAEIGRVTSKGSRIELRFPIDDGFKRDFLSSWSRSDISGMWHAYVTRRKHAHHWILNPDLVSRNLGRLGFSAHIERDKRPLLFPFWLFLPRWRRFLPRSVARRISEITRWVFAYFPKLEYEWVVNGERAS